jgi:hypothetical protein
MVRVLLAYIVNFTTVPALMVRGAVAVMFPWMMYGPFFFSQVVGVVMSEVILVRAEAGETKQKEKENKAVEKNIVALPRFIFLS